MRTVAQSSFCRKAAAKWLKEIDLAQKITDIADSGRFRHLDTELSNALHNIFSGEFERKVILAEEENLKINDDFLSGRQSV